MAVETSRPEVRSPRESSESCVTGTTTATAAPVAIAPSVDRWSAARLLRRSAWPLALRHPSVAQALEPSALRAVLVPAWRLDVRVQSTWTCGDERSGTRLQRCAGLVVSGVAGQAAGVVGAALAGDATPSEIPAAELSDWHPLGVTRPLAVAWSSACAHLSEAAAEEAALGLSLEETDHLTVETRFEDGSARPLLVPAWKARVRVGSRDLSVFVEACNAGIVGRLPWNRRRLAALAGAAGVLLGALWVVFA